MTTIANSPVGGSTSASTTASIGSGLATLVNITGRQTVSNATLTPDIGVGAMSAGYGGTGETLTYEAAADFNFMTLGPQELYLTLLGDRVSGVGFDCLKLQIDVDGTDYTYMFTSLDSAEALFTNQTLDLGPLGAGGQAVDMSYWLTASELGAGFGFDYTLVIPNLAVPEPSTWAMTLIGFAGLRLCWSSSSKGGSREARRRLA